MVKATWNGHVIAQSDDTKVVEGNHYFPPESVDQAVLQASATKTTCPWKGEASYYSIDVGGARNPDAAWFYADPLPEAAKLGIKDHVAFWKGVEVR